MSPRKNRRIYQCNNCDSEFAQWEGRCRNCGEWNSLVEVAATQRDTDRRLVSLGSSVRSEPMQLVSTNTTKRFATGIPELDRVFGGGLVSGAVTLLAGDPGIGKSTLILQASSGLADAGAQVLYVSGEESVEQIKLRADRLGLSGEGVYLLASNKVEDTLSEAERISPSLVVVDSIQTCAAAEVTSAAGTLSQIQACTALLTELAKRTGTPVILTGHVTKEGGIAGPRLLEHAVDVVLHLSGDPGTGLRIMQGAKNRFGATSEIGVFEMRSEGLVSVDDPSKTFMAHRREDTSGSAVATIMEGARPITVEVQALTNPTALPSPRRIASGVEMARLHLILAVLSRRLGIPLASQDVIVNVPGGLKINEPAIDLAVALAIVSSMRDVPVKSGYSAAAEIGLGGELRSALGADARLKEARRLGMDGILLAADPNRRDRPSTDQTGAIRVETLTDAISLALVDPRAAKRNSAAKSGAPGLRQPTNRY